METDAAMALLWIVFTLAWMGMLVVFTMWEYPTASNADRVRRRIEREAIRESTSPLDLLARKRRQNALSARVLQVMGFLGLPAFAVLFYQNGRTLASAFPASVAASAVLGFSLVMGLFYLSFVARYWIPATLDEVARGLHAAAGT